jgi:predicted dehydrogenase
MLEMKDLDAVNIGTPDHWHCLPMVDACAAGKDVYVEKPLGNSIAECNVMVEATRKYGRIVQVGQQQRSGDHWQQAIKMIQTGGIGKLRKVNVWGNFNYAVGQKIVPDGHTCRPRL